MIPWVLVDSASIPGAPGTIRLMRRGAEFSIVLDGNTLMNSRMSGSEVALATETIRRMKGDVPPAILIGGLGMGFTLRAALAELDMNARISVAELIPAVVAWARGPMAEVFAGSVDDARVRILERDVGALIAASSDAYDAILLDVDNGPEGLTRDGNDGLYGLRGLAAARRALKPAGLLSIWSVAPDDAFAKRMERAGFAVEDIRVRADRGRRGTRHVIWIGRKR